MLPASERLYNLLPAIYRIRDLQTSETLRAFMGVLDSVFQELETDIDGLYNDWFIETCQEDLVPYIADLVGVAGLLDPQHIQGTRRRRVANTATYRRRSGTLATIEDIARDQTGWSVHAVDLGGLVSVTQNVQHARADRGQLADVHAGEALHALGGAFETTAHTIDVRHVAPDASRGAFHSGNLQGRYNLANVGIFFWRLQTYPVLGATPARIEPGRYTFDPLGRDVPLFQPATATSMPAPVERRPLSSSASPAFSVLVGDRPEAVPASEIAIVDLSHWRAAPASTLSIDPTLGRIACRPSVEPHAVNYWYGFSADIGGGPYSRQQFLTRVLGPRPVTWQALVGQHLDANPDDGHFRTLADAVQVWNRRPPGDSGVIAVIDNGTYATPSDPVVVQPNSRLALIAARCLDPTAERPGALLASGVRPCVRGDLIVVGRRASTGAVEPGECVVDGLLVDGAIDVRSGDLGRLELRDTTLVPDRGGLRVRATNDALRLVVEASICGPLRLGDSVPLVQVQHSIIDAGRERAIDAPGATVEVRGSTLLGSTVARVFFGTDSLFVGPLHVERVQAGGIVASYVPPASRTPSRSQCQPDLALQGVEPSDRAWIQARLVPDFTSLHHSAPGYAQLTPGTPSEIRAGASGDGEMGAFYRLRQPLRMSHFLSTLAEHLPDGREVGVFFMS